MQEDGILSSGSYIRFGRPKVRVPHTLVNETVSDMQFFVTLIEKYGLLAVFLNLFAEGMGLPLPSYPILMIAAALAPQMHYSYASIIAIGMSAALLADCAWYWSGRYFGASIVKFLCRISLSPESCVQNTNMLFGKIGPSSLSFAKFIPGFSTVGIVLASSMNLPLMPVIFFDVVGVLVYITGGVVLGALFHDAIADTLNTLTELGRGGILIVAALLCLYLAVKWLQRKHFIRQLRMNRITVDELYGLIGKGETPVILDVRPHAIRQKEGMIPGSIIAYENNLKSIAARFPAQSEVIVYCSCPNEASAVMMAQRLRKAGFKKIRPLLGGIDAWAGAGYEVECVEPTSIAA
jgi:membrane protein DedA with SNARE-associated domain/rhodanese-related sulfurtransferase